VQIDISFTCRRFDRRIASDPSGTNDAPHARLQPQIRTVTRSEASARRPPIVPLGAWQMSLSF